MALRRALEKLPRERFTHVERLLEAGSVQIFVIGPPRSGTTIVTQLLNHHERIKIYDEVDFIHAADFGPAVVGKLFAFLAERSAYDAYRARVEEVPGPAALSEVMAALATPETIWGEKNPMYATRVETLKQSFPKARLLFLLRDPREVVGAYLAHRASPERAPLDFWIKDTVSEALALVERCLEPLAERTRDVTVLRYEDFLARPAASLDGVFQDWDLEFSHCAANDAFAAPETVGDHQFFRRGAPLPWKLGNLSPLKPTAVVRPRLDPLDPAWSKVDELARSVGYA